MLSRLRIPMVAAVAAVGLLALGAAPASAAFHLMKIREVFAGTASQPQAQFVELQMYSGGQNFVQGHRLRIFDAAGAEIGGATFGSAVADGNDQATILIATQQAAAFFGVTPDLTIPAVIRPAGGKVCFDDIDCVSWGAYTGPAAGSGTPFRQSTGGLVAGHSAQRDIAAGDPARVDPADDTGDSAADFDLMAPTPRPNSGNTGSHGLVSVTGGRVTFAAASGVADRVTVSGPSGGYYTVRDTARAVRAGAGCARVNATDVRCPSTGITGSTLVLGDGGDIATSSAALKLTADGGTGDDKVTGGGGNDVLKGGTGIDVLDGRGGTDVLDGGSGADQLIGGDGTDTASYAARSAAVTVTLDGLANDGSSTDAGPDGTRDKVLTENVRGGNGADQLTGGDGVNVLTGNGGGDALSGKGSADTILAKDGVKDTISCGTGTDTLKADIGLDAYTPGTSDCESVSR